MDSVKNTQMCWKTCVANYLVLPTNQTQLQPQLSHQRLWQNHWAPQGKPQLQSDKTRASQSQESCLDKFGKCKHLVQGHEPKLNEALNDCGSLF